VSAFIAPLLNSGVAPKRIYSELINNLDISDLSKPDLKWLQSFVNRKRSLKGDEIELITECLKKLIIRDDHPENEAYLIGVEIVEGKPIFECGSDLDPFVAGLTSFNLLRKLLEFKNKNQKVMFHMDCTFKVSNLSYPLLILGASDVSRTFFPLTIFVVSQSTPEIMKYCLNSFKDTITVFDDCLNEFVPDYIMSDADPSNFNAIMSAFGSTVLFLTCYFHVIKNVREWLKHKPEEQYLDILNVINNIHFSMSSTEFINILESVQKKWTRQGFKEI
jgi:hypothetical protein